MKMSFLEKVKVCFGNMFIKFPKLKTTEMIHKGNEDTHHLESFAVLRKIINVCFCCGKASVTSIRFSFIDQKQLDEEITALHKGLREKVNRLNEIQGTFSQQNVRLSALVKSVRI